MKESRRGQAICGFLGGVGGTILGIQVVIRLGQTVHSPNSTWFVVAAMLPICLGITGAIFGCDRYDRYIHLIDLNRFHQEEGND